MTKADKGLIREMESKQRKKWNGGGLGRNDFARTDYQSQDGRPLAMIHAATGLG